MRRVVNLTRSLARFPRPGRVVPEFGDDQIRELLAYSYRIIYRVLEREVLIVAVVHGKRLLDLKPR